MKVLYMKPDTTLYFKEEPKPVPAGGQVLIRMAYASICNFDIMMWKGTAAYPPDGRIGHEGSGVVEAVGSEVISFQPGDLVTILPSYGCGLCEDCRSKREEYCSNIHANTGLMAEYVLCDQRSVFLLPPGLGLREGCLTEPLMMAMEAVRKANLSDGANVVLMGCGAMGQIILKLVRRHPVGKLVVIEPDAEKRKTALRFGADFALNPDSGNIVSEALLLSNGRGYDAVLEISGSQASAKQALHLAARGGSVVFFALYGMNFELNVNLFSLYWKDITITAVGVPSGVFPRALRIAPSLRLSEVITGMFPFDQAVEAFEDKARGGHAKVMLTFPGAAEGR